MQIPRSQLDIMQKEIDAVIDIMTSGSLSRYRRARSRFSIVSFPA